MGVGQTADTREPTFGERAVGLSFNPSGSDEVHSIKSAFAAIIDDLNQGRLDTDDEQAKRLYSIAITEAQGAQMWAVKAATWTKA